jgi:hypothetical protein
MATQWQTNPMRNSVEITPIQVQKKQKSILPPFDYKPKELVDTVKELRIELQVDQPIQITSGKVTGSLTLHCFKEQRVGRILVYLCGVEQQAKEKRVFLQKSWVVQESHLVPGEAVYPSPPDEHGMWKSKVQSTKFEFSIPFKETVDNIKTDIDTVGPLPSSYYYPKVGGIRYFVIGLVDSKDVNQKKPRKPLAIFKELLVLESVPFSLTNQFDNSNPLNSVLEQTMTKQIKTGLFGLGKPVEIHLGAKVWTLSMDGQVETGVWQSGTTGYVKVSIENQTNKPVFSINNS